jgi:formylglycine-generating enzyme required for sulfatase activity
MLPLSHRNERVMNVPPCINCKTPLAPGARFCSACGTPVQSVPAALPRDTSGALARGTVLQDRYKLINFLGEGGFSRVYGAVDLRLRTPCAIKENSEFDRSAHDQFIAEAQLLARLKHQHMTKVTDYFATPSGAQFLVMEYVPGKDLEKFMREATALLDWRTVAEWGVIVCDVLDYLHGQEPAIIHRDIKPANLRLTPDGTLMVIDLGIAKIQKPGSATTRAAQAYSGGYSPIEQYLGQGTDARSDLYSLGATMYHLLTAQLPTEAPTRLRGASQPTLEQARTDMPTLMARAIDRAMALEPDDRPPSAAALKLVFERVLEAPETTVVSYTPNVLPTIAMPARIPTQPGSSISQPMIGLQPGPPANHSAVAPPAAPRPEALPHGIIWREDGREMVPVEGGSFPIGEEGFESNEQPVTLVELGRFLIDRFPVTCGDYARFTSATNYPTPPYWGGPTPPSAIEDHPVVEVSLNNARAYARWANKRLPTEAEWEKAASWDAAAGAKRRYPWGDAWDANCANGRDGGAGGTVPIGSYSPAGDSPCGAAEMVGSIWEWTASTYKKYPYDQYDGREDPDTGGLHSTRGGSWTCSPDALRAANRNVAAASHADFELGFRCAADSQP